eukprot:CAMPEP_0179491156 /NCGR_PEP_ID=MMETSP0799-20121207/65913_1 /TAXON_ID=46947 /ORGANISM="Geminigera cryophila, Strain CCMP2564" /LENGTH=33 /DNA_ID= /DNA_START= /DNA_END= /DNA_ORIENTATION=
MTTTVEDAALTHQNTTTTMQVTIVTTLPPTFTS